MAATSIYTPLRNWAPGSTHHRGQPWAANFENLLRLGRQIIVAVTTNISGRLVTITNVDPQEK